MAFHSILFKSADDGMVRETPEAPECFGDLLLDQVIDAITAGRQEYNLKPFFYTPLHDVDAIVYRHEVMRDLEDRALFEIIKAFARKLRSVRIHLTLADKLHYKRNREGVFLNAVEIYCDAVTDLVHDLAPLALRSRGLLAFRDYVTQYAQSERFTTLLAETGQRRSELASVQYCVIIKGDRVRVRKYQSEIDYSAEIERTFEKFKQGATKDHKIDLATGSGMNHVEAQILDFVARLYPDIFASLEDYCTRNAAFLDETLGAFEREIQFYIAYLEHIAGLKQAGLKFCYPEVSLTSKEIFVHDSFDIALAYKLVGEGASVVCNDFTLRGKERIFVVSGPNQGGKTTFARMFGQLHYLASLGCPVPGRQARLFLPDRIFTHFEKEETIKSLRGKLQDDLVRIRDILSQATPNSIIILNEIFTSTTTEDNLFLSKAIMERIMQLDLLCVFVTFVVELASLSEQTVSMVSTVVPDNPALRTFKIVRRPADGLSYAISIAEKHGVTYESIKERIQP